MENETVAVQKPLVERIKAVEEGLKQLLAENKLEMNADITFPIYKILPDEVELAMVIIRKHGAKFVASYIDKGGN